MNDLLGLRCCNCGHEFIPQPGEPWLCSKCGNNKHKPFNTPKAEMLSASRMLTFFGGPKDGITEYTENIQFGSVDNGQVPS